VVIFGHRLDAELYVLENEREEQQTELRALCHF